MRLIDADALKEMIPTTSVDVFENCRNCSLLSEEQVNELIDMTPTANPWIPCSERLPEEHEWVGTKHFGTTISDKVHITFDVNGERFVRTLSLQNGELSNSEKHLMDAFYKGWRMLAWMPLPEAWKGESNDN